MASHNWKLPFNIAIAIHILILLGGLYLPNLLKNKPKFADIYTVSIVNVTEALETSPAPHQQVKEQAPHQTIKSPEVTKKAVPLEPEATSQPDVLPPVPAPVKAVSLKPIQKKKLKEVKEPPQAINDIMARKKREQLAAALREEQIMAEQARLAREALENEKKLLTTKRSTASTSSIQSSNTGFRPQTQNNNTATGGTSSLLKDQYYGQVKNRIHQHWALPEYLQINRDLVATVSITINRNGRLANIVFEKSSGNRLFDQFVRQTLSAASPMPPIPAALKKQRIEIGLIFLPGGIQ